MKKRPAPRASVGLKHVAQYLGLNPATVSVVLNDRPGRSIPEATRERIRVAARELNYQPSLLARSLQSRRTKTIGILVPELDSRYYTQVLSGIGERLINAGYFYFTAHHGRRQELIEEYSRTLLQRGAEAIIAIDTLFEPSSSVPLVSVAGERRLPGVANIVVDHRCGAELLLAHLHSLGHRRIAFVRSDVFGSPRLDAWRCLAGAARKLGIAIHDQLVADIERPITSPEVGYPAAKRLLSSRARFTALVAFSDVLCMGVLRGLQGAGLRVPEDVSVAALEDSGAAALSDPPVTAVRWPLVAMGSAAAQYVLDAIGGRPTRGHQMLIKPELVIRESTAATLTR